MPTLEKNPDGTPHIHQYARAKKPNGKKDPLRYRCMHHKCSHWEFKANLEGKESLCALCGQIKIILDYEALRRSRPACFMCGTDKQSQSIREKHAILQNIFGDNQVTRTEPEPPQFEI